MADYLFKYAEKGGGIALASDLFWGAVGASVAILASPFLWPFSVGGCANEGGGDDERCTECHPYLGNGEDRFISGEELEQYAYGVGGAHKFHYNPRVSNPLSCSACHPTRELDWKTHIDPKVRERDKPSNERDVILGGFDPAENSCMVSYCHGNTKMFWNVDYKEPKGDCNYCHFPTEPRHDITDQGSCYKCHDETISEYGDFKGGRHMNFKVEVTGNTCAACHGEPPKSHPEIVKEYECSRCHDVPEFPFRSSNDDPHRNGEVSVKENLCFSCHGDLNNMTSGAHPAHLNPKTTASISCQTCHGDLPMVGQLFEHFGWLITFSGLAVSSFSKEEPRYDAALGQCSSVYCHGAGLKEGPPVNPLLWLDDSGNAGSCGGCHGLPPVSPEGEAPIHDPSDEVFKSCSICHPAPPTEHINGKVDLIGDY